MIAALAGDSYAGFEGIQTGGNDGKATTMGFIIESKHESSYAATIRCAGELDVGSCRRLIDAIESAYGPELERLCVDLSEVTFIDSTGIGCLIHADLQCRKQDVRLEIVPGAATLNLIRMTHLGNHLPLTEDPSATV